MARSLIDYLTIYGSWLCSRDPFCVIISRPNFFWKRWKSDPKRDPKKGTPDELSNAQILVFFGPRISGNAHLVKAPRDVLMRPGVKIIHRKNPQTNRQTHPFSSAQKKKDKSRYVFSARIRMSIVAGKRWNSIIFECLVGDSGYLYVVWNDDGTLPEMSPGHDSLPRNERIRNGHFSPEILSS